MQTAAFTATTVYTPKTPTLTMTATPLPPGSLSFALQRTAQSWLAPTSTAETGNSQAVFRGIGNVGVLALSVPAGTAPVWAVYSQGSRSYNPPQNHSLALFTLAKEGWREISRLELQNPDFLGSQAVKQVNFDSSSIYLQVQSGAGAHSGCFDLLAFDGSLLHEVLTHCSPGPAAGALRDLDSDGILEILLDLSDPYILCYTCGVRLVNYQVWRWNGSGLELVQLKPLPASAPQEIRRLNDRALELARADLWKDAQVQINAAAAMGEKDETLKWNLVDINLIAGSRAEIALSGSAYPLLNDIFAGDYQAAVDLFRPYRPTDIFSPKSPLIAASVAEGREEALSEWITQYSDRALQVAPDLAAAYFLRGWAAHLTRPASTTSIADILHAAKLAPEDDFYVHCAGYFGQN